MNSLAHNITHYYQPTTSSCGYAALSMLLSHYDEDTPPEKLMEDIPQPNDADGNPMGSITTQLATWCQRHGYDVTFTAFDCQILDLSWQGLSSSQLIKKLQTVKDNRNIPNLGKTMSATYVQSYIELLQAGGEVNVYPHVTSELLYDALATGPIYANVCAATLLNQGRQRYPDSQKRIEIPDDINGFVGTHSVVVYGNDEHGTFLVADPWKGKLTVAPETLLCSISAAQIECDDQIFQVTEKHQ